MSAINQSLTKKMQFFLLESVVFCLFCVIYREACQLRQITNDPF